MKILNTDNFGSDYPNESFVENLPCPLTERQAQLICDAINSVVQHPEQHPRYWRVVSDDYQLQPGFEP
jgi:hypothetical protein